MTERAPMQPTIPSRRRMLDTAVTRYQVAGSRDVEFQKYVARRELSDETVSTFRLGVVSHPMAGHEKHVGRLAIPYLHHTGYPLAVRFRCMENHDCRANGHGKYMSLPDDPVRMFNTSAVLNARNEIHVTEGEFDAMILTQLGLHAIAIPGAKLWTPAHATNLRGFSRVWVWQDPDEAGSEFVNKVLGALHQAAPVTLDMDVNDLYLSGGKTQVLGALSRARKHIDDDDN
jgi:DNA primase